MGLGGTRGRGRVGDGASGATRTRVRTQRKGSERGGEADLTGKLSWLLASSAKFGEGKGGKKVV